jgi:raffinose/stachyose/melibiose transport system substrate-binding protein
MKKSLSGKIVLLVLVMLVICSLITPTAFMAQRTLRLVTVNNGDAEKNAYEAIAADFMKANPGVKVEIDCQASDTFFQAIQTRSMSMDLDIGYTGPMSRDQHLEMFAPLIRSKRLVELTQEPFIKNFLPASVESGTTLNDKVWGVPLGIFAIVTYYNPDLLKKCGVAKVPATKADFLAALKAVEAKGYTGIALGMKDGWQTALHMLQIFNLLTAGKTDQYMNDLNNGKNAVNGPVFTKLLQTMADLAPYYTEGAQGISYEGQVQEFTSGKAAFMLDGTWQIPAIINAKPAFQPGIMVIPVKEKASDKSISAMKADPNLFVLNTPQKDIALKFLAFLSQKQNYIKWQKIMNVIPTQAGVPYGSSPMEKQLLEILKTAAPLYENYTLPGAKLELIDASKMVVFEKKSVADAVKFLKERWDASKPDWKTDLLK